MTLISYGDLVAHSLLWEKSRVTGVARHYLYQNLAKHRVRLIYEDWIPASTGMTLISYGDLVAHSLLWEKSRVTGVARHYLYQNLAKH
jgi:uncharacterized ferritin-like protein (DUF455 family)